MRETNPWTLADDAWLFALVALAGVLFGGSTVAIVVLDAGTPLVDRPEQFALVAAGAIGCAVAVVALRRSGRFPSAYLTAAGRTPWDDLLCFELITFVTLLGGFAALVLVGIALAIGSAVVGASTSADRIPDAATTAWLLAAPAIGAAGVALYRRGLVELPSGVTPDGWDFWDEFHLAVLTAMLTIYYSDPILGSTRYRSDVAMLAVGLLAVLLRRRGVFVPDGDRRSERGTARPDRA